VLYIDGAVIDEVSHTTTMGVPLVETTGDPVVRTPSNHTIHGTFSKNVCTCVPLLLVGGDQRPSKE
jgi:hypothetical protein